MKTNLKNIVVETFLGRSPKFQGKEKLLADDGLLSATNKRTDSPAGLRDAISMLIDSGMEFETIGCGLKVGRRVDGRLDSVAIFYNVDAENFTIYVIKRPPEDLPKFGFETDGNPVRGANSKSSRVFVKSGTAMQIRDFILSLPSVFENGRKTQFNKVLMGTQPSKEAPVKKEKKAKKTKEAVASVIQMPITPAAPAQNPVQQEIIVVPRRKKAALA